jgi:uracil-DNA glycosylase
LNRDKLPKIKSEGLERLNGRLLRACRSSELFKDSVPVFGSGPVPSAVMIVGEAPGREETRDGLPFVGKAGRFLISVLKDVFARDRDGFYITNVVKVWPRIDTARGRTRKPLKAEEEFFIPYLKDEIRIVGPRVIIAVGKTAFSALEPGRDFMPGQWYDYGEGVALMPVYHPSYLLRKQKTLPQNTEELKTQLKKVRKKIT